MASNYFTQAGGRIVVYADSLVLYGDTYRMQASGIDITFGEGSPFWGGTGGYIYIKTYNVYNSNYVDEYVTIEASGAPGYNGGYAGSGGVIIFDHFNVPHSVGVAYGGDWAPKNTGF